MMTDSALPLLGFNVWWGMKGVKVDAVTLQHLLTQHGFATYMPDPVSPQKAVSRAVRAWVKTQRATRAGAATDDDDDIDDAPRARKNRTTRDLVRTINHRSLDQIIFALVDEEIDFDEVGLAYGTQARIALEKVPAKEQATRQPAMICTTEARGVIAAQQEAAWLTAQLTPHWHEQQQLFLSSDLSRTIRVIVDSIPGAVCVRSEGGVYFVPVAQQSTVEALRACIEALPTDGGANAPYCIVLPVPDEATARREMAKAVHTGFVAELTKLDKDFAHTHAKAATVRPRTINEKLTAFRAVRDRARVYADLLQMQQETIETLVTRLEQQAKAALLGDDDDEVPAEPTPEVTAV